MLLQALFGFTILVSLQKCEAQFTHYDHQPSSYRDQSQSAELPHYRKNIEIYNSPEKLRQRAESSYSDSDIRSTEVCECSCNECFNPKACCSQFCKECQATNNYIRNLQQQHPQYHTLPQSNLMVVQYAVPAMMFKLKNVISHKSTGITHTENGTTGMSTDKGNQTSISITTTTVGKTTAQNSSTSTDAQVNETTTNIQDSDLTDTTVQETVTTSPTRIHKQAVRFRTTRKLEPEFERFTKKLKLVKLKRSPRPKSSNEPNRQEQYSPNAKIEDESTIQSIPTQEEIESIEDDNLTFEYYDYPEESLKQKINDPRCQDGANCYTRDWNRNDRPGSNQELKLSRMPHVRLRPTLAKPRRRYMAQPSNFRRRFRNDKFANKLMRDLKYRRVLAFQNIENK